MAGVPEQAMGMGLLQATQAGEEACGSVKTLCVLSCPHGVWDQLSPYFLDLQPHWFSWLPNLLPYILPFLPQWFSISSVGRWLPLHNKQQQPVYLVRVHQPASRWSYARKRVRFPGQGQKLVCVLGCMWGVASSRKEGDRRHLKIYVKNHCWRINCFSGHPELPMELWQKKMLLFSIPAVHLHTAPTAVPISKYTQHPTVTVEMLLKIFRTEMI